jgi:hypothetical protein
MYFFCVTLARPSSATALATEPRLILRGVLRVEVESHQHLEELLLHQALQRFVDRALVVGRRLDDRLRLVGREPELRDARLEVLPPLVQRRLRDLEALRPEPVGELPVAAEAAGDQALFKLLPDRFSGSASIFERGGIYACVIVGRAMPGSQGHVYSTTSMP